MSRVTKIVLLAVALAFLLIAKQAEALFSTEVTIKNNVLRSGKLSIALEPSESLLTADNLASGSTVNNKLSVTNTGTIPNKISISSKKSAGYTTFFNALKVTIKQDSRVVYDGPLAQLQNTLLTESTLTAGQTQTFDLTVELPLDAPSTTENSYTNVSLVITATEAS